MTEEAFTGEAFAVEAFPVEVLTFDPAALRGTVFAELDNFNAFDGGLWDDFETAFPVCLFFAFLPGLLAAAPRDFEGGLCAEAVD